MFCAALVFYRSEDAEINSARQLIFDFLTHV